jgi:hypothetical protein
LESVWPCRIVTGREYFPFGNSKKIPLHGHLIGFENLTGGAATSSAPLCVLRGPRREYSRYRKVRVLESLIFRFWPCITFSSACFA